MGFPDVIQEDDAPNQLVRGVKDSERTSSVSDHHESTRTQPSAVPSEDFGNFVQLLRSLFVQGPLDLTNHNMDRGDIDSEKVNPWFLGKGKQFKVYRNAYSPPSGPRTSTPIDSREKPKPWIIHPVAVKKCYFPSLEPGERLDLGSDKVRGQIHDMRLEIIALNDPKLRHHRNIVKLIGWAVEDGHQPIPLLVMELALGHLGSFVETHSKHADWSVKHQLCLDMGAGLDATYDAKLIHGDFKPDNVLIFPHSKENVPFIAKVADFGFSDAEADRNGFLRVKGLTPGWHAPELKDRKFLIPSEYRKADNFSYGLVIWSVLCLQGSMPQRSDGAQLDSLATDAIQNCLGMPEYLRETAKKALQSLLCHVQHRVFEVRECMRDASPACKAWMSDCNEIEQESSTRETSASRSESDSNDKYLLQENFEMGDIRRYLLQSLEISYRTQGHHMTGSELFAIFLYRSYATVSQINFTYDSLHIQALIQAARKGFVPAQALVFRVLNSYSISWIDALSSVEVDIWLFRGVSTGSGLSYDDLKSINLSIAEEARQVFRENGGLIHLDLMPTTSILHQAAMLGDTGAITQQLRIPATFVNALDRGKTALYVACVAGHWRTVKILCEAGADASIASAPLGLTCLHQLSNFSTSHINEVADLLVLRGANPDAIQFEDMYRDHFPFVWLCGTPLHHAVQASNRTAVAALLRIGADLFLRNTSDPYLYDINVRYMDSEDDMVEGGYHRMKNEVLGFNSMDLAAANHDWGILEEMLNQGITGPDVFRTDEEGYSPFHRLEYNWIGRTFSGMRFWYPAFTGSQETRFDNAKRTIQVLQRMGGDIDSLTRPPPNNVRRQASDGPGSLTPLMLAVIQCDIIALRVILNCGANAKIRNSLGNNALSFLREERDPLHRALDTILIVQVLLEHGAEPHHTGCPLFGYISPIQSAVSAGSLESIDLLLDARADPTEKFAGRNTFAMVTNSLSVRVFAERANLEGWESKENLFIAMINRHVFKKPQNLPLDVVSNVDEQGSHLLHYAARAGLAELVSLLITTGSDANVLVPTPAEPVQGYNPIPEYEKCWGTPLDMAHSERQKNQAAMIRRQGGTSPEGYNYCEECFKQVERILLDHGGRYMHEIDRTP